MISPADATPKRCGDCARILTPLEAHHLTICDACWDAVYARCESNTPTAKDARDKWRAIRDSAAPPVTGESDAAREWDGSLADSYNWADRTPQECLAAARAIERDAHAAGLARGRALGAREEREALVGIISDRWVRCGYRTGTCRSCMEDGAMIEIIEARRAGRGTK